MHTFDHQGGRGNSVPGQEGDPAAVSGVQVLEQKKVAPAALKGDDLHVCRLLHRFVVDKPVDVLVLRPGQRALEKGLPAVERLNVLQTLDNLDGLGCGRETALKGMLNLQLNLRTAQEPIFI